MISVSFVISDLGGWKSSSVRRKVYYAPGRCVGFNVLLLSLTICFVSKVENAELDMLCLKVDVVRLSGEGKCLKRAIAYSKKTNAPFEVEKSHST